MYHGTARNIGIFQPKQAQAIFLTDDPFFAEQFAELSESYIAGEVFEKLPAARQLELFNAALDNFVLNEGIEKSMAKSLKAQAQATLEKGGSLKRLMLFNQFIQAEVIDKVVKEEAMPSRGNVMPLYVRAEKPFDYENPEHVELLTKGMNIERIPLIKGGSWREIESDDFQNLIKDAGFDSFYVKEGGRKNLAVYDSKQIKSSIGNIGTFSRSSNDIRYALALGAIEPQTPIVPDVGGNPDGNLGMAPEILDGKPIRMLVGTHNDIEDKGFGANHILTRVMNDRERMQQITEGPEELLERIVKTAKNTAGSYFQIFKDGGKYVFYNGRNAIITTPDKGALSVVTMFSVKRPESKWGRPIWNGKAPSMPAAFVTPVRGRGVVEEEGRVAGKKVETEVKKRRVITPNMVASAIDEVEQPTVAGTLGLKKKMSLRDTMPPDTVDAIDRTTTTRREQGLAERMAEAISPTAFAKFRQGMINKYESIERLSGKVAAQYGDNELLADQSAIGAALFSDRAAGVAASSFRNGVPIYRNGFTTVSDLDGQVKGLIPILEPLMELKDPFAFQAFQFYAATKRGKRLTAEGREKLFTPDDIRKGAMLERQFPMFKQVFEEYQKYNKGLVDYMKSTGVLSEAEAEMWTQNWDYIPFYRQMDGEATVGPNVFSAISGVSKPKKLKGSEAALADFVETVVRNSRAAIEAGMKNVAAQRVARDIVRIGQGQQIPAALARGNDIMTVKEDGKTVYYQVDDPLLVESVKSLNLPNLPFLDILSMPTRALRELVTKDPGQVQRFTIC